MKDLDLVLCWALAVAMVVAYVLVGGTIVLRPTIQNSFYYDRPVVTQRV
jgi:hypothetical protein